MATFFWDWKGVMGLDFLQERRTINAEYYSRILFGEAQDKIRTKKKTRGNRIFFLQDNAGRTQANNGSSK